MKQTLGGDFEKKMQVVGVLKQYAQDLNIDQFCSALDILLHSPQHRAFLREIRYGMSPLH